MALSLEYIAGFFDGEGCVRVNKIQRVDRITPQYALSVSATQCSRKVLDELAEQFGGGVYVSQRPQRPTHRTSWQWMVGTKGAVAFLEAVRPFLVEKTEQAWLGLEFVAACTRVHGPRVSDEELALREGFYLAIAEAKRGYS